MTTVTPSLTPDRCCPGEDRDDAALLAAVAGGDRTAFAVLYRRHAPLLLARLRRRTPPHARDGLAEEVLQDVFVAVWRGADRYTGRGPVAAWLGGIAGRRLSDALRRHPHPTAVLDLLRHEPAPAPSAEDEVLARRPGPLGAALERLDPPLRAVLQTTVVEGRTTAEAARLLGVPVGTVKSRAARARAQLRRDGDVRALAGSLA